VKGIAAAGLALVTATGAAAATSGKPHPSGWQVSCVTGTDEFASNCRARSVRGPITIEFATGDSQFYLKVEASSCRDPDNAVDRTWWRDELTGLTAQQRKALLSQALGEATDALAKRCPELRLRPPKLGAFPDIAVFGDPA